MSVRNLDALFAPRCVAVAGVSTRGRNLGAIVLHNLREIAQVKRQYPKHAVIVSLMVESKREAWHEIVKRSEDTGADGLELNFGCPHGMSERGMGAAVGQVPDYVEMVARWCKAHTRMPVLVKLTPNVTNILGPARAAKAGGADGVSLNVRPRSA